MAQPSRERLEKALRNAHNAGDTAAARRFAGEIRKLDAAPQPRQAAQGSNPNLRTYRVPERMFGMNMPYAGGETEVVTNDSQGYQIELPVRADDSVKRGIVGGTERGDTYRQATEGLQRAGAATLDAWGVGNPGPVMAAPASTFTDREPRSLGKTGERVGAFSAGAVDLPTFGFSDELAGAGFGDEAKRNARRNIKTAWERHPVSAFAGGLPALFIPGQGIKGVTTMAKAGSAALRGGLFGAAYGYGSGEGGPLSLNRLWEGGKMGAGGAVVGPGFILGGRGLDFMGRKILGSAEVRAVASHLFGRGSDIGTVKLVERAITEVQRAAKVDGQSIDRVVAKQRLTEALGKAEMNDLLGDIIPGGVSSMEGSALPGMAGADKVVGKLSQRGEGQYERINQAVGKIVEGKDIAGSLANLARVKEEEAGPLYRQAFDNRTVNQQDIVSHPRFGELQRLVQLDDYQRGREAGERVWRLRTGNPDAQFSDLNMFEQLDWVKRGLDAEIGKLLRAGDNVTASALIGSKEQMLSIADDMNPVYGQARRIWGGAQEQQDAILLGESLFTASGQVKTGEAMREIRRQYDTFSDAEKTAFSIGLFERAMESVGTVAETALGNSAKRGFLSPNSQRAIRDFLPEEQADEFLSMMEREFRQQMNTNQVLGGSATGRRINAGQAVQDATAGMRGAAADLSDPQGLIRKAQDKIRRTIGNNPRVQRQFAEFLTRSADDPQLRQAFGIGALPQLPPPPGGAPAAGAMGGGTPPPSGGGGGLPQLSPPARATERLPDEAYGQPTQAPQGFDLLPQKPASMARPEEPTTLTAAVKNLGGIKTRYGAEGQNLSRGEFENVPGMTHDKGGKSADDMVRALQEDGFDIVDENDLYRALNNERAGQKTYRIGEGEEYEMMLDAYNSRPMQNGFFDFGRKPQAQQPINRAAAVRYNGRTVSGWNDHESALVELDEMFGGARVPRDQVEFGFVGNDGQFVSRTDQGLLLDLLNNNQLTPEATRLAQKAIRNGDEFTITAEMITEPRSRSNALPMLNNPTTGGAVLGGIGGGSMAQDLDGDGRVSMQERYAQGTLSALAGGLGGRAVGKLDDRMISQGSRQVLEGRAAPSSMGAGKPPVDLSPQSLPMDEASRITRKLEEMGYDGIIDLGGKGGGPKHRVAIPFKPNQVRSKYATFDPAQSESPVLTAGIGGRRRKDMLKDVMPGSQGARVPGTRRPQPKQLPQKQGRGRILPRMPEIDMYELRPQIMSGLTAGGLGGGGLYIAYSQYKAEQERRNQPSMDYEAFVAAIQDQMRREKGLPPTPSPKPALPMLAQ